MVLHCIARVVGGKRSVRRQDFVTKWANTDHIEPEHAYSGYSYVDIYRY